MKQERRTIWEKEILTITATRMMMTMKNITLGRLAIAVAIARIAVIGMIFMVVTRDSIEMISAATMIIAIMATCGD